MAGDDIKLKVYYEAHPKAEDIEFLTQKINTEARSKGITDPAEPFAFFIRDERVVMAGCNGSVIYGTIYTDQLWVHPAYRKKGLGKVLMDKVHDLGKERGCTQATVCTMSFQEAQAFYESLGYICDFTRSGYTGGAKCLFMVKSLN